ncbi:hypothetical protein F0562_001644 [Nyssa sinensis]|uniref:Uncharacterized protein n=1 Tax=Nyssa sinensis TaxID=561372 RepID=A0A5J5C3U5_9ASTE|nr:hypothetical protein F0562_001644 [Nyssa sinensis]
MSSTKCSIGHECFYAEADFQQIGNRKVLYGSENKEAVFKSGVHGPTSSGSGGNLVGWELRNAPSGPDPLHHNGGSSKKPDTP